MRPDSPSPVIPFLIACAGIATYSAMDVLMKGLSIDIGAYNAVLWRTGAGTLLSGLLYFASRPKWPGRATLRIHAWRSLFVAGMTKINAARPQSAETGRVHLTETSPDRRRRC